MRYCWYASWFARVGTRRNVYRYLFVSAMIRGKWGCLYPRGRCQSSEQEWSDCFLAKFVQFHKFLLILFNKIRQATRVTCSLCTCCGGPSTQAVVAAAISGDSSIVEMLLAANADVDARNAKRCCTFSLNGSGSFRSSLLYIIKRRAGQMTRLTISS